MYASKLGIFTISKGVGMLDFLLLQESNGWAFSHFANSIRDMLLGNQTLLHGKYWWNSPNGHAIFKHQVDPETMSCFRESVRFIFLLIKIVIFLCILYS